MASLESRPTSELLDALEESGQYDGEEQERRNINEGSVNGHADLAYAVLKSEISVELIAEDEAEDDDEAKPPTEAESDETELGLEESTTDALQLLLRDIGKYPLLTAAQEVQHAKSMERGINAEKRLSRLPRSSIARMSTEEKLELQSLVKKGKEAKETMINCNMRLVINIAKRYRGNGVAFLDLIQEGTIGVNRAVEKFDYHRGLKFSTYATWWITQAVRRAVANQARTIRVPVHVVEREQQLKRKSRELQAQNGHEPTYEELAEATGLSLQHVTETLDAPRTVASLNRKLGEEGDSEFGDFFVNEEADDPEERAEIFMRVEAIRGALSQLSNREREIIELRFGVNSGSQTLEEIGKHFGITRERVRQLESQALRKLSELPAMQSLREI